MENVMLVALIQIISLLANVFVTIVIVSFVMSLLISFNVISLSNQYVEAIYNSVNALIDPLTRPIRKFMPDTGMIDFSPMVLIIGLQILLIILGNLEASMR